MYISLGVFNNKLIIIYFSGRIVFFIYVYFGRKKMLQVIYFGVGRKKLRYLQLRIYVLMGEEIKGVLIKDFYVFL